MSVLIVGCSTTSGGVKNYVRAYIKTLEEILGGNILFTYQTNRNLKKLRASVFIGWRTALKHLSPLLDTCSHFQILELGEVLAFTESLPPFTVFDVFEYKFSLKALDFYKYFSKICATKGVKYDVITASNFVKLILSRVIPSDRIIVLPPPVTTFSKKDLITDKSLCMKRENMIVEVCRFTSRKRLEEIIFVARKIKNNNRVFVLGYREGFYSKLYYSYLSLLRELLGVRNMHLIPNVSNEVKEALLLRGKVFLHPRPLGAFEMAVAESMSLGLVPVVRYGSTAWMEVLDKGKYGFAYRDINECAEIIEYLLDGKVYEEWSFRAISRAEEFSYENFKLKLIKIIKDHLYK